jgi:hypothetical protein
MELSLVHAIKAYGRMEAAPCCIFPPPQANKFLISLFFVKGFSHTCLQFAAVYFG